jgi:tetratricopeptide (TPR) repeat protein
MTGIILMHLTSLHAGAQSQARMSAAEARTQEVAAAAAETELVRGRIPEFRAMAKSLLHTAPGNFLMGEFQLRNGRADSAAWYFREGLKLDANHWGCLTGLGHTLLPTAPAEAEALFTQANSYRQNPALARTQAYIARAYLYLPVPAYEKVRSWLNTALATDNKEPATYLVGAEMYIRQKKGNDALTTYMAALDVAPGNIQALYGIAQVYFQGRLYERAIESLDLAFEADSLHLPTLRMSMEIHYRMQDYTRVIEDYQRLQSLGECPVETKALYAAALFFDKRIDQALPVFDQVLGMNPENPSALRLKAYAHQYRGEFSEGVSTIEKFFASADSSQILDTDHIYHARLLLGTGNTLPAWEEYGKAMLRADTPDNSLVIFAEMMDSIHNRKLYETADQWYRRSTDMGIRPTAAQHYYWAEDCYYASYNRLLRGTPEDSARYRMWANRCDSLGLVLSELSPGTYHGLFWQASAKALLDPKYEVMEARPLYEQLLTLENLPNKPKLSAYKYLGSCAVLTNQTEMGLSYYEKYLEINPNDAEISGLAESLRAHMTTP